MTISNGGNLKQGLQSAAQAYATSYISSAAGGGNWFARGMVGGALSYATGGKFGHGFVSAAIRYEGNNIVVGAIIRGTVSAATGGKFANGAITGAFAVASRNRSAPKGSGQESAGATGQSKSSIKPLPASQKEQSSKFRIIGSKNKSETLKDSLAIIGTTDEGKSIISQIEGDADISAVYIMYGHTNNVGAIDAQRNPDNRSMWEQMKAAAGVGDQFRQTYSLIITLDPTNTNNSFYMQDGVTKFKSDVTRLLAHELGHAKNYSSFGTFRFGTAVQIENIISRQLDHNAPLRHLTKDHGTGISQNFGH